MEGLTSIDFMATYLYIMCFVGLMFAVTFIIGFYLVYHNKLLETKYKIGWIVSFFFLNVVALLVYLAVFSMSKQSNKLGQ